MGIFVVSRERLWLAQWLGERVQSGRDTGKYRNDIREAPCLGGTRVQDASDGIGAIELTVAGGALNSVWRNGADAVSAGIDKRMLAENVDHAGNAAGIGVDAGYRVGLKYGTTIGSCDAESLADIAVSLFRRERSCPAADGDALVKLAEFVTLELGLQLRLARQAGPPGLP